MRTKQRNSQRTIPSANLVALAVIILFSCSQKAVAQQWNTNGNDISNANTGNVGIGTASPKTKLDIKQSADTFVGGLHLRRSTTNDTWALVTGSDNSLYMGYANNASGADAHSDFTVYPLVLTGSGNVGIGTATPNRRLELVQDVGGISFEAGTGSPNSGVIRFGDNSGWKFHFGRSRNSVGGALNSGTSGVLMTIQDNGNVGIGITAPAFKLDVQGGQVNAAGGLCIAGDCKTAWSQIGGGDSQWTTAGSTIYYNDGNVGIGTTSPTQKLEVNGSALIGTIYGSSAAGGVLSLQSTSHTTKGTIQIGVDQTSTTSIGQSGTSGNKLLVATDRLIVNNSGVRINGAPDNGDLSVTKVNISNADALQFRSTAPNIRSDGSMLFIVNNTNGDNVRFNIQNSTISNAFVIDTNTNTPARLFDIRDLGNSRFTVSGTGNVGIGTPTPGYRLDVQGGSINSSGGLCIAGDCKTSWPQVNSSQWTTSGTTINYTNGNVGIGTTTPGAKLEVVGNVNVTGTGNITAAGTIEGGNIVAKYQDVAEWVESFSAASRGHRRCCRPQKIQSSDCFLASL